MVSFCHLLLARTLEKRGPAVSSYATFSNNTGKNDSRYRTTQIPKQTSHKMTVPLLFGRMFSRGQNTCALAPAVHTAEEPYTHPAEKEKKPEPERQPRPTPLSPSHHLTGSTSSWTGQQQNRRNRTKRVRHLKPVPWCEHRFHDSKLEFCDCDYCTTIKLTVLWDIDFEKPCLSFLIQRARLRIYLPIILHSSKPWHGVSKTEFYQRTGLRKRYIRSLMLFVS